jgi:hypothetical protein
MIVLRMVQGPLSSVGVLRVWCDPGYEPARGAPAQSDIGNLTSGL